MVFAEAPPDGHSRPASPRQHTGGWQEKEDDDEDE